MSSTTGGFGTPGFDAIAQTSEIEFLWGGDAAKGLVLRQNSIISGSAVDAGATPTSNLRPGLLMGKVTSSGKLLQWDSAATDGSQNLAAINYHDLKMIDFDGNTTDRVCDTVVRAPLKASQLLIKGVAFTSAADQYLARRLLAAAGCILDDDPFGYLAGQQWRTVVKTADYTVLATDNGTLFTTRGAVGAVNFTLPAIAKGLEYKFFVEADQSLTITSATADTLVVFNDLAADTIAFSTSSEKIGGSFTVRANDDASKWLVFVNLGIETQTPVIAT